MELAEEIIDFKSNPKNYKVEESGKKANTERIIEPGDDRIVKLYDMAAKDEYGIIRITNTETGKKFIRRITNVTKFGVIVVVSWDSGDVGW